METTAPASQPRPAVAFAPPADMTPIEDRARSFLLAAMAAGYPDRETWETLAAGDASFDAHPGLGPMAVQLRHHDGLRLLRQQYMELFDTGKQRVSLYETEYGRMRGMAKGRDLADLNGFYLAFGMQTDADRQQEMIDHIAVEMEFYGLLLLRQQWLAQQQDGEGTDIVLDARRKFLHDHLGRFPAAIAAHPAVAADAIYGPALAWAAELVARECEGLGVTPPPLDFFADAREGEEVVCGDGACLPGMPS